MFRSWEYLLLILESWGEKERGIQATTTIEHLLVGTALTEE
jgi:hypothetical protein